jgi:hypothetical protein
VRLSGGIWKSDEHAADVLGIALRLPGEQGDQDLIFATFRHLWSLPLAPLTTDTGDFFANCYYAVTPFRAPGCGTFELRLVPAAAPRATGTRAQRLAARLAAGTAALTLEMRARRPLARWRAAARIELTNRARGGGNTLLFSPSNAGRGVQATGLINALRGIVYRASQAAVAEPDQST